MGERYKGPEPKDAKPASDKEAQPVAAAETGGGWTEYYENTKETPPSELLRQALSFVHERGVAMDLGAGGLKDTRFLLDEGFETVIAVDGQPEVRALAETIQDDRLEVVIELFAQLRLDPDSLDLVNAQFSLPFSGPDDLELVLDRIKRALKSGGVFNGQLFGDRDQWSEVDRGIAFVTEASERELFSDMELLSFREIDEDGRLASGHGNRWHYFDIIARKH